MTHHVIIVAAGTGSRFGGNVPKQFCDLSGRPVLMMTIDAFRQNLPDAEIVVVISTQMMALWNELCERHRFVSPVIVAGGASRSESVYNAMMAIDGVDGDVVLIHDGARPLVDGRTIDRVISAIDGCDGVIPAVEVTDSIRRVNKDGSSVAVDRSELRAVQTPQAFWFKPLRQCYENCRGEVFTDDASMMEKMGHGALRLVDGSVDNIKITNAGDIDIARLIIERRR